MVDLKNLCKNYKILIDTSTLMLEGAQVFYEKIYNALYATGTKIILPRRVYDEIVVQARSVDDKKKRFAKNGLAFIKDLADNNLLDLRGEEGEVIGGSNNFADALFHAVFSKLRLQHNLCLITQDRDLAIDMLNLKYSRSVSSPNGMSIGYVDNKSYELEEWEPRLERTHGMLFGQNTSTTPAAVKPQTKSSIEKFDLPSSPLLDEEHQLLIGKLPTVDEYVYTARQNKLKLVKFIASGGEGELFETDGGFICKIYKPDRLTDLRKRKLDLMLSKNISIKGVCLPKDLVFNLHNQFVGYLMERANGSVLQTSVFGKQALHGKFPNWKREHLVRLALTITRTIADLHDRNIIIGDINPSNILVVNENNVFFVDTDSYQIESFPCPVGTPTFTSPDLQGVNYSKILRTKEQEMFAIATLIFMILFPGKTPYSSQGGSDLAANIKNRNFSYVREEGELDKKPFGIWPIIWSHLPPRVKNNFEKVFANGSRLDIEDWLSALSIYLKWIQDGRSSNELFPSSYRVSAESVEVQCTRCKRKELASKRLFDGHGIKIEQFKCIRCRGIDKLKQTAITSRPSNGVKSSQTIAGKNSVSSSRSQQQTQINAGILNKLHRPIPNQTQYTNNIQQQKQFTAQNSVPKANKTLLSPSQKKLNQYSGNLYFKISGFVIGAFSGFIMGNLFGATFSETVFLTIFWAIFLGLLFW